MRAGGLTHSLDLDPFNYGYRPAKAVLPVEVGPRVEEKVETFQVPEESQFQLIRPADVKTLDHF